MRKFKSFFKKLASLFPTRLPLGMTEYNKFIADVIELTGPVADKHSMEWVIASSIINMGPQRSYVAKNYFVRTIHKAAATQLAGAAFLKIKEEQKQQAEATAQQEKSASNGSKETEAARLPEA